MADSVHGVNGLNVPKVIRFSPETENVIIQNPISEEKIVTPWAKKSRKKNALSHNGPNGVHGVNVTLNAEVVLKEEAEAALSRVDAVTVLIEKSENATKILVPLGLSGVHGVNVQRAAMAERDFDHENALFQMHLNAKEIHRKKNNATNKHVLHGLHGENGPNVQSHVDLVPVPDLELVP